MFGENAGKMILYTDISVILKLKTPPLPEDYWLFTENGPTSINAVRRDPDIERVRR